MDLLGGRPPLDLAGQPSSLSVAPDKGDVWLIQRYIPGYAIPRFALLSDALNGQLVVAAGADPAGRELTETPFRRHRLRNTWVNGEMLTWQSGVRAVFQGPRPRAIIAEHSLRILTLLPTMLESRLRGIPFILWGHGRGRRTPITVDTWPNRLHRQFVSRCDAYVNYTSGRRTELSAVTDPAKLFVAQNTLDTRPLFAAFDAIEKEGRAQVKQQLALPHRYYVAFVGRLIEEKRVDLVLETIRLLRAQGWDVGGVIVGDGPLRTSLEAGAGDLPGVRFLGQIDDLAASAEWLGVADVMLAPGTAGLLINHALALGVPIVTSGDEGVLHGPEIEYLQPGLTGDTFVGGADAAASAVASVLQRQAAMRLASSAYARENLAIANWVRGMTDAIAYATSAKP